MRGTKTCKKCCFLMRKGTKMALKPSLESEPKFQEVIYYPTQRSAYNFLDFLNTNF